MISFVIAAYNEEKNLERCVSQILQSSELFEIIIVDDGSKDNTLEIAWKLAQRDRRIKVVHQENAGVSVARNTGLDHVTGRWVAFADADDLICASYLTVFSQYTESGAYEILQGLQFKNEPNPEDDGYYEFPAQYMQQVALNRKRYIQTNEKKLSGILESVHGTYSKLFCVDMLKANHIRFHEGMGLGEDLLFYLEALEHTDKVLCLNKNIYQIYENPKSSTRRFNPKMINYAYLFNSYIFEFYEKYEKDEEFYADMCAQIVLHIDVGITYTILKSDKRLDWKEIKAYYAKVLKDTRIMKGIQYYCNQTKPSTGSIKQVIQWLPIRFLSHKNIGMYLTMKILDNKYVQLKQWAAVRGMHR